MTDSKDYKEYIDAIKAVPGAGELADLMLRWDRLIDYAQERGRQMSSFFPDMFWITPPGSGKTTLLRLLSDYLSARGAVLSFDGNVKFVEFSLEYTFPEQPFDGIRRLTEEIEAAAGYRPKFRGIVHVELDRWTGHENDINFRRFLTYLSDHSDDWLIVLSLTGNEKKDLKDIEAVLCSFLRLETVVIRPMTAGEMADFIKEQIAPYGLSISPDGRELLLKSLEKLRSGKYFDGMHTLKRISKDIIYQCLSEKNAAEGELGSAELKAFAADGEYVTRQLRNTEVRRTGFLG